MNLLKESLREMIQDICLGEDFLKISLCFFQKHRQQQQK